MCRDRRLMICLHQDRPLAARPSLSFLFLLSSSSGSGGGGRGRRRRRGGGGERPGVGRSLWLGQRCMLVFLHPPHRAVRRGWRSRRDSSEGVHERERVCACAAEPPPPLSLSPSLVVAQSRLGRGQESLEEEVWRESGRTGSSSPLRSRVFLFVCWSER